MEARPHEAVAPVTMADVHPLEQLNHERDLARLRIGAIDREIDPLVRERAELVAKIELVDVRIEQLEGSLPDPEARRRYLEEARSRLDGRD